MPHELETEPEELPTSEIKKHALKTAEKIKEVLKRLEGRNTKEKSSIKATSSRIPHEVLELAEYNISSESDDSDVTGRRVELIPRKDLSESEHENSEDEDTDRYQDEELTNLGTKCTEKTNQLKKS